MAVLKWVNKKIPKILKLRRSLFIDREYLSLEQRKELGIKVLECLIMRNTYGKSTIYIIGDSKTTTNNPITHQYTAFFLALVIDLDKEEIVDMGASATLPITNQFIQSMFIGYSMKKGIEPMIEEITHRYHGASQKAMIVAWKDAYKKYHQIKNEDIK